MSINSKMTALADEIRTLSGTTDAMGLDAMKTHVSEANDEVNNQVELLAQVVVALDGKAASGGSDTTNEDGLITRTLTEYTNNRVTTIGANAFQGCTKLTTVSLLNATSVGGSAFNACSDLCSVHLPALKSMGSMVFYSCTSLETIELPSLTSTGVQGIRNCTKLAKADLGSPSSFAALLFGGCSSLEALIIRTPKLCTLGATSVISDTKIAKGTGYIYVPRTLSDGSDGPATYAAATNWSTYAAQIRAIEDYPDITGG